MVGKFTGQPVPLLKYRINKDLIFTAELNQKRCMPDPGDLYVMRWILQNFKIRLDSVFRRTITQSPVNISSSGICEQSIFVRLSFVRFEKINAVIFGFFA